MQLKGTMRSALVVVAPELPQRPAQVTLIEDDDAIQALLSDSADPPFCVAIQVGRAHRQLDRLGAAGPVATNDLAMPVGEGSWLDDYEAGQELSLLHSQKRQK